MIKRFINNDEAFIAWLKTHPNGYVLNLYPHIASGHLIFHRAACGTINRDLELGRHWTKGYGKACASDQNELEEWASRESPRIVEHHRCMPEGRHLAGRRRQVGLGLGPLSMSTSINRRAPRPLARRPRRQLPTTVAELNKARGDYLAAEPRDLFYRVAGALIGKAWGHPEVTPTVGESITLLLLSWNASFYRFRAPSPDHVDRIEELVSQNRGALERYRATRLTAFEPADLAATRALFAEFERVLGIVGAAKALHLLAPNFFPIWDRRIAERYGVDLNRSGSKADAYAAFADVVAGECAELGAVPGVSRDLVKLLDEFNYVTITVKALREARERRAAKAAARRGQSS